MILSKFLQDNISFTKGSIKIPLKGTIDTYREKYQTLIKDKTIQAMPYRVQPGNRVMIHFKIPSSTVPDFYYDVLLELTPTAKAPIFEDCEVRFFSNSPSFIYGGYAYLFYHMDIHGDMKKTGGRGMMIDIFRRKVPRENLLVPGSAKKLGKDAVTQEPEVRNPMGIALPDSSIYYAIFHMLDNMSYAQVMNNKNTRTERQILDSVADFTHLMAERTRRVNKISSDKKDQQKKDEQAVKTYHATKRGNRVQTPTGMKTISTAKSSSARTKRGGVTRIG